jgi:hypothetical protein
MHITYYECVYVALVTQQAKRMRLLILLSVACLALPYFFTLSHKRHNFLKKKTLLNKKCVLIFSTNLSQTFLILRRIQRDIIINIHRSLCKVPFIIVRFLMKLEFSRQIFEKKQSNIKFHENPSSGSRAVLCGRTDRHYEANSRFFEILRTHVKKTIPITPFSQHIPRGLCWDRTPASAVTSVNGGRRSLFNGSAYILNGTASYGGRQKTS